MMMRGGFVCSMGKLFARSVKREAKRKYSGFCVSVG